MLNDDHEIVQKDIKSPSGISEIAVNQSQPFKPKQRFANDGTLFSRNGSALEAMNPSSITKKERMVSDISRSEYQQNKSMMKAGVANQSYSSPGIRQVVSFVISLFDSRLQS